MFWRYFDFFIYFLWQLPQNIVALCLIPFIGKMKLVRYDMYTFAFKCTKIYGGISLGNFIFLSPSYSKKEANILHEYGHVIDSHKLGWLYLFIIKIPLMFWKTFKTGEKDYYDFFTERRANKHAGLKVAKNQYGSYLYIPKEKETTL